MIDYFALGLTHALILLAVIRLAGRKDLDDDPALPDLRKKTLPTSSPADSITAQSDRDA
ncbi:hypothetical protein GCM10023115_06530 [Pontixanthobacter gangjinensis]|uniref:Uncharacterized protein n=1 Tax=Pontixanthobacter gangjinensis TaxID=1028742 RepID=A0A6I4SMA9_9SPHN|nr:hypothetical protein [Pontixanthobacter gangjinensis]MXO55902.1 hypothetical protein [Pontixanthobacter gangjinensis]